MQIALPIACVMLILQQGEASAAKSHIYFSYLVLDRFGKPVPNTSVDLVAMDDKGKPYGQDATWGFGVGSDAEGLGDGGFGDSPAPRPGRLDVVARHPSIGESRVSVEWSAVLHATAPLNRYSEPQITLRAEGGPGLDAWRESATKKAPALVQSLMKAKNEEEIKSLTRELAKGEMSSVSALVVALRDYANPQRNRLVVALIWTWNGCRGLGPLEEATKRNASSIYRVNMAISVLQAKPQAGLSFVQDRDAATLREVAWVIENLQAEISSAQQKGDVQSVQTKTRLLSRMKEAERQMHRPVTKKE